MIAVAPSIHWNEHEDNPDYKLVIINAANEGFQSKMSMRKGSFFITQFTQRLADNICNKRNERFLNQILNDVQECLHNEGKQLMTKAFNNGTENIKFVKKGSSKKNKRTSFMLSRSVEMEKMIDVHYVKL